MRSLKNATFSFPIALAASKSVTHNCCKQTVTNLSKLFDLF
ncbi:hypothetical protein HMPREF9103_00412 [Lentilactobacillus parafarraginis F0439]|uniref:Uncharacterized protein n=1 Tax=Lentilactobacillus parafarraginis F0439 TaxID=797515 RepID=G9ZL14_9LACO|nr:hypothetical protein HMPREF9103_00412 [Lentilactobacillus parafarraginis F0439]